MLDKVFLLSNREGIFRMSNTITATQKMILTDNRQLNSQRVSLNKVFIF